MSRFQTVPINIAGGTGKNKSKALNSTETINFYPEIEEGGKNEFVLQSFPGLTLEGASGLGDKVNNGATRVSERYVRVAGGILEYYRTSDFSTVGSTPLEVSATNPDDPIDGIVDFADDGVNIVFVYTNADGAQKVKTAAMDENGVIGAITEVPEGSTVEEATSVTYLNNQFIYTTDRFFFVSQPNQPFEINGLNGAGAESNPDDIVRGYAFNQLLWIFGKRSVEAWYNSGVGAPPFERVDGKIFNTGLGAKFSVANNDNLMYWLGDDYKVYVTDGGALRTISSKTFVNQVSGYSRIDDAVGFTFSFDDQNFYAITFPTEGVTWCLSEGLGKGGWFNLASSPLTGGNLFGAYEAFTFTEVFGKTYCVGTSGSAIYTLDNDNYGIDKPVGGTIVNEGVRRRRTLPPISGEIVGARGKRIQMSRFELILEKGTGNITGDFEDPKILLEASYDGGKTFAHEDWLDIGRLGDNAFRCEWFNMDSFYELTIRLTVYSNVQVSLHAATIDLRGAGR